MKMFSKSIKHGSLQNNAAENISKRKLTFKVRTKIISHIRPFVQNLIIVSLQILYKAAATLSMLALATCAASSPAMAASKNVAPVVEHLHLGQKVANYFRRFGLPDLAVLAIISAMPVVELRGAIPVGLWMGLPIATVLPICVLGNMLPIVPLMFLLKNKTLK